VSLSGQLTRLDSRLPSLGVAWNLPTLALEMALPGRANLPLSERLSRVRTSVRTGTLALKAGRSRDGGWRQRQWPAAYMGPSWPRGRGRVCDGGCPGQGQLTLSAERRPLHCRRRWPC